MKDTKFFEMVLKSFLGNVDEKTINQVVSDFATRLGSEVARTVLLYMGPKIENDLRRVIREELENIVRNGGLTNDKA